MNTITFVRFNTSGAELGRITSVGDVTQDLYATHVDDLVVATRPSIMTDYVANNVIVQRPANTATLNGMVLSGLVVGSSIVVTGVGGTQQEYSVTADTVTLSFPKPGSYKVLSKSWPMLEKEFQITV